MDGVCNGLAHRSDIRSAIVRCLAAGTRLANSHDGCLRWPISTVASLRWPNKATAVCAGRLARAHLGRRVVSGDFSNGPRTTVFGAAFRCSPVGGCI
jgi:hypothetical protein